MYLRPLEPDDPGGLARHSDAPLFGERTQHIANDSRWLIKVLSKVSRRVGAPGLHTAEKIGRRWFHVVWPWMEKSGGIEPTLKRFWRPRVNECART